PDARAPLREAGLLVGLSLLLMLFAAARATVQRWIAQALFRQGGLARLPQIVKAAPRLADEEEYLDWAADEMAAAAQAGEHAILPHGAERPEWAEALIPGRLGPGRGEGPGFRGGPGGGA